MIVLGLTGSIGMGKSATAALFAEAGTPVHDSDAAVHALYAGPDAARIEAAFPGVLRGGLIDRARLSERVLDDPVAMRSLEAIVHPYVARDRDAFLASARQRGEPIVVLDIPLLFEIGGDKEVDAIVVVTADEAVQRARVLARPGMTPDKLDRILARQTPDSEKRRRAHFVIDTGHGVEDARRQVRAVLRALARRRDGDDKALA